MGKALAERRLWRWCALAGIATLATSFGFGAIDKLVACGGADGLGPIMRFELARTPGEVAALFGEGRCREMLVSAMRAATWLDALVFIPAYCGFLILALLALRGSGGRIALAAIAAVALAGLLDEIEGAMLFVIMDALPGTQGLIDWLIPLVRAKFALIGAGVAAIGALTARRGGIGLLLGTAVVIGGVVSLSGLTGDARAPMLILGNTIAWPCILLAASIFAIGRSRPPAPA